MYTLAGHLAVNGMDPTDLPLVVLSDDSPKTYIVMDGNRRIAALRLLADPSLAPTPASKRRFKEMASKRTASIQKIDVVVAPTRAECTASIRAKHYGESKGIGRVPWSTWARLRFDWIHQAEEGANPVESRYLPVLWAIDMVEGSEGPLPDDPKPPMTSFERMFNDPRVRKFAGFEMRGEELRKQFPDEEILRTLSQIVHDIVDKKIQVDDIKNKALRKQYLGNLDDDARPRPDTRLPKPVKVNLQQWPSAIHDTVSKSKKNASAARNATFLDPKICQTAYHRFANQQSVRRATHTKYMDLPQRCRGSVSSVCRAQLRPLYSGKPPRPPRPHDAHLSIA